MNKQLTIDDVLAMLQKRVKEVGNQKTYAERHFVSPTYVGDILKRKREPGEKILDALNLRKVVVYVEKE